MNLPRAVVEAEKRADEAFQQIQASRQGQAVTQEPDSAPKAPDGVQGETVAPVVQTTPAPSTPSEGDDKWEARYKTLDGKYKAEVPRLHQALKDRESQLNSLTEEVEALKRTVTKESLVKPEEVQEFGEPLVDLIRRAAREEVSAKDAEIQSLKKKMEGFESSTTANTEATFYENLAKEVPDWMTLNNDPAFHSWLAEHDDLTGYQRQEILSQAESKRDANRVARFFNAFKQVQGKTAAAASSNLESQIAPDLTRSEPPQQGKKIWTRAEVADFYSRDRRGEYTEKQSVAIDTDIQLAVREGRIR